MLTHTAESFVLELNLIQTSLVIRINIWLMSKSAYFYMRDENDSMNSCLQQHRLYSFLTNKLLDHTLSFLVEWPRFPDCQALKFVSPAYKYSFLNRFTWRGQTQEYMLIISWITGFPCEAEKLTPATVSCSYTSSSPLTHTPGTHQADGWLEVLTASDVGVLINRLPVSWCEKMGSFV